MIHEVRLAGHGVRLDPLEVADAAALWPLTDDALWAGMVTRRPADVTAYAEHAEAQRANPTTLAFTVRGDDGEVRGTTTLYDLVPTQGRVELGSTWYGRAFWGGRTNPATKLLLLGHAFDTLGLNRVALRCDARNLRSAAAIRRLGAVPEGVLRSHRIAADGTVGDTAYFSILRAEWPRVRDGLEARLA
ncbi:GNAT family N-acetyltransferase [Frigoribacterium sp. VKM Ac-2836]|uniref:GNAT family N-acetyltransferase n=1 Tax=Frigoribacterium sp. VKM Ac-2836 TaxID=2739014 RepID=UPI0015668A75|nr:GNAT family protein [Frigoribacterium sp. VKM Ac-2836]NRD27929.1 GNAT family N-acetyltransferase [Frigoribacterium sp. VKM Ac-2836]